MNEGKVIMKKVKLSTPFWLGDTVYGVLAFSVGEGNKIKYVVKPMEVTAVHYLPIACNYNRICFVCVTSADNETGEEYFNTPEFFAKTKEHSEELKKRMGEAASRMERRLLERYVRKTQE